MSQISQIKKIYHAAIYVRLSKEDGAVASHEKTESNSIANQKSLIRDFLENKNDIEVVQEYVDDGFSGSNFERPAFQMMLEDIKKGKIDCVVTKDLSRFGREYIDSGMYIERLFPAMGVRFIAINDGIDSGEAKSQSDEIIIPFKNLINDAYCRDISIKIRSHLEKIGVKRCYERDIGEHMWSASTVMEILYNEVYIGSVINNKTADNIDTGHQVVQRDKEDWIIVENCHEPLVSVEDFKLAHKMIARREVTKRKPNGKWRKSYIRCGICGKGLYKYGNKSSYRCHNGHVSRIRGEELEATLLDIARNMALAQLQEFELKTDGGNCPDNLEREIESLKKSKAHYAKLKFEIYDDYTKTNITRDQMAKKTAEVKQKIAEIESLITEKQETLDMQKDLFLDAKQEQLTKLSKLDEFDEEVIRYLIDYVLVYDNEHIEIRWNFDDFQAG